MIMEGYKSEGFAGLIYRSSIWLPMNQYLPAVVYDTDALGGLLAVNAGWFLADAGLKLVNRAKSRKERYICDKI